MKLYIYLLVFFSSSLAFAQKDSLQLGDAYLQDQLYFGLTFNQLFNQPETVSGSGFSYGVNLGYIKDISLVKSGRLALGFGAGYAYDSFNHSFKIQEQNSNLVVEANTTSSNNLRIHALEFPLEFRWRTSNANKYKFWRIYTGVKFSYNLKNTFNYFDGAILKKHTNIDRFNKWQYGLTISAGYATFNFNMYYGLSPLLNSADVGTKTINTQVMKIGILFYFL